MLQPMSFSLGIRKLRAVERGGCFPSFKMAGCVETVGRVIVSKVQEARTESSGFRNRMNPKCERRFPCPSHPG